MTPVLTGITAGIEQTRVAQGSSRPKQTDIIDAKTSIPTAAAVEQNNTASRKVANNKPDDPQLAAEQIRVSVTTGESNVRGNLTPAKAAELYQQIAKLL